MLEIQVKENEEIKKNDLVVLDSNNEAHSIALTLEPIEKFKNKFIEETFDEFKQRIFDENLQKLNHLMAQLPEKFVGCEIKKQGGRFVQLLRGGLKIMELFNHDVIYSHFQNNELIDLLKQHITEKIQSPFKPSHK